jgi:hypothetical protein
MVSALLLVTLLLAQSAPAAVVPPPANPAIEPGVTGARRLTSPDQFIKAGESYFSPNGKSIVFQAIERPSDESAPDEFYAMFVADLVFDASGDITGVDHVKRVSPRGSANTCGWFHPTKPHTLLFASTIVAPTAQNTPGYQRGTSRYRWSFPPETRIVEVDLAKLKPAADVNKDSLAILEGDGKAYVAEGSLSTDGRHLLFCSLESGDGGHENRRQGVW